MKNLTPHFPLIIHPSQDCRKQIKIKSVFRRSYIKKIYLFNLLLTCLFAIFALDSKSQINCLTTPTATYDNNDMVGMASGTYDDPIVIRLYLHVVRNDDGSGGLSALNLQEQIDFLDDVYNPWHIYFDYCVRDFKCSTCFTDLPYLKSQWETNSLDDGMNGYLLSSNSSLIGEAEDVGAKNFFARIDRLDILAHELGHALGLFHTHQNSFCPPQAISEYAPTIVMSVLVPGSNSSTAGDRITDTPADVNCYNFDGPNCTFTNPTSILDYLGNPYIDPNNVLPVNIMSYNHCPRELTPKQNERIRDMLVFSEELAEVVSPFSQIKLVIGTEEWTTPLFFNHDVRIEGNLTISTNVGFAPGCGLIVEKGAYLSIDGGTLTLSSYENTCSSANSKFWNGIMIKRDGDQRGFLETSNHAVIEHADQAIYFDGIGPQWLLIDDCTFRNNRLSLNNTQSTSGPARFTLCDFIIDENYLGSSYYPQVQSLHSYATWFRGCQFLFEPVLVSSISRQAISSYDGQILVTAGPGSVKSRFENWTKGVNASQSQDTKLTLVRGSEFIGNKYGIFSEDFWKTFAYDNEFDISNDDISSTCWGIYTSLSRSVQLHDNKFSSTNTSVYSTGIHVDNTVGENLVIGESDFTDLDIGVDAERAGTEARGLMFLCNKNEGNRDFDFKTTNGIAPRHGNMFKPAGNTFSHTGVESASDFSATGIEYNVFYFRKSGADQENPIYITTNVKPTDATSSIGCEHFGLFQDPFENDNLANYITYDSDISAEIEDKEDELDQPNLTKQQITELSADLELLELDKAMNISYAISFVLIQDSLIYNDLRTAINLRDDFRSEVSIAQTWIDQGDFTTGISALESISNRMTLNPKESLDLDDILALTNMLVNVYNDDRIESQLSEEEIDTVEKIANDGIDIGMNQARALLVYFYGFDFSNEVQEFEVVDPGVQNPIQPEELSSWPNPANDLIEIDLPEGTFYGKITVANMEGRIMTTQTLDAENDGHIMIKTGAFPPGVYVIALNDGGNNLFISRFIK